MVKLFYFVLVFLVPFQISKMTIFNFNKNSDLSNWYVVDDKVMGGVSAGSIRINEEGYAVFKGDVSLENNGGFSSVRYRFPKIELRDFTKVKIKLKGDGKNYQFRIKANSNDYYSYTFTFQTTNNWDIIDIPLSSMYPVFRGRRLNMPNFNHSSVSEVAFLIANKRNEKFELLIDSIELI